MSETTATYDSKADLLEELFNAATNGDHGILHEAMVKLSNTDTSNWTDTDASWDQATDTFS